MLIFHTSEYVMLKFDTFGAEIKLKRKHFEIDEIFTCERKLRFLNSKTAHSACRT